ncbi:serine/arginine repetitive matrix protein 1-like [Manis pentadactyla]|uniref:serine/arginine repetitive matrix protein 1-like n=1 Tax=Manis pentadactyla TaxID=143292 RepID=UPI00255C63E5|nr:serine/arginine repetitive matrix protein 1-like [Manis pentadactyla]
MCVTVPAARPILWRPGRHRTLRLPARSRTRPPCHSRRAPRLSQRPRLRHEDAPIPLPSSRRGPGSSSLPTLPYPTPPHRPGTRAARASIPPLPRPATRPAPFPSPSRPHPRVQRGRGLPQLRPRPPPRAAAGASPALRGSRARHSHKMSALTELLPAATLRPSPLLLPLHRRVSVRHRCRREHRTRPKTEGERVPSHVQGRGYLLPDFPSFRNSAFLLNRLEGHKLMKLGQEIRVLGPKTRYSLKHPEETEKWDWPVLFS